MFSYCCNNPVNYIDPSGKFFESLRNYATELWHGITTWFSNTFGFVSSLTTTVQNPEIVTVSAPFPFTITHGTYTSNIVTEQGNSNAPICFYSVEDVCGATITSGLGVTVNAGDFSLGGGMSANPNGEFEWSYTMTANNYAYGEGIQFSFDSGVRSVTSYSFTWDRTTATYYTTSKINLTALLSILLSIYGVPAPSPAYGF